MEIYLPPDHNLIVMLAGCSVLSCLVLWLQLRSLRSHVLTPVYLSVAVALPFATWWLVLYFSGPVPLALTYYLLSLVSTVFTGAAVWLSCQERPHGFRETASAVSDLFLSEALVAVPLGVLLLVLWTSSTTVVLFLASICISFICAVVLQVSQRQVPLLKPSSRYAIRTMAGFVVLLLAWHLLFRTATYGRTPGVPGYPDSQYGLEILISDLFSLLAVMIARLLLAVWKHRTRQATSRQVGAPGAVVEPVAPFTQHKSYSR